MVNRIYKASGLALSLVMVLLVPASAQTQIDNNQPVKGVLHTREALLQLKLNGAYRAGLIDSNELAAFQRDFDGILAKEEDYKTRPSGMTSGGKQDIEKRLYLFEERLARHANKSGE
ncbi:MAG: hypothetical protein IPP57_21450 [Candidatus Obscuribacter sp.]|nr:hypothetical protein [Candidatus Obscuribacter sp.]